MKDNVSPSIHQKRIIMRSINEIYRALHRLILDNFFLNNFYLVQSVFIFLSDFKII
jgi:hypothetical protein